MAGLIAGMVARPLAAALGAGAVVVIAFGAGWGVSSHIEHGKGERHFPLNILGQSLGYQLDQMENGPFDPRHPATSGGRNFWRTQSGTWYRYAVDWRDAERRCEDARNADNSRDNHAVETQSSSAATQASQSYQSGYRAGRVAGSLSCGTPHAPSTSRPSGTGSQPSGVQRQPAPADRGSGRSTWDAGAYVAPR